MGTTWTFCNALDPPYTPLVKCCDALNNNTNKRVWVQKLSPTPESTRKLFWCQLLFRKEDKHRCTWTNWLLIGNCDLMRVCCTEELDDSLGRIPQFCPIAWYMGFLSRCSSFCLTAGFRVSNSFKAISNCYKQEYDI